MKRSQDIEVSILAAEVLSLQSKLAFQMEKTESSVPHELYDAKEAENAALKAGMEALLPGHRQGRENWLQCGSHEAAKHTAFMYSLVESCRMNGLDFGLYIETVLRRILDRDTDIHGMLPNVITLPKEGQNSSAA